MFMFPMSLKYNNCGNFQHPPYIKDKSLNMYHCLFIKNVPILINIGHVVKYLYSVNTQNKID